MKEQDSKGLLSRFFPRKPAGSSTRAGPKEQLFWADKHRQSVTVLVNRALRGSAPLIVTGYQDFLSSLAYLITNIENLNDRPSGTIRMVFGTNTDSTRRFGGAGQPVAEEAAAYFLGSRGFAVEDLADLRAILAIDAIERGIIALRVYDPEAAQIPLGRRPPMLHAKLVICDDHALSGSANFSNGGLRRNLEFMDDAADVPELAKARREAAERFWVLGRDWTEDALRILRSQVRLVTPEEAVARTVIEATGFTPWIAAGTTSAGRLPQPFQAELIYEAAGTIHEHGFAFVEAPTGAGKTDIGKHLAALLPVAHDQTVFSWGERADQRRLGSLALIPASVLGNWTTNAPINFTPVKHSFLSKTSHYEDEELEAEGINLQRAAALGILGVTSDIKSLIQGLGRIDRIDSPHPSIHYFTFDLPGLALSSDKKARTRVESIALLSGVGADELPDELVEFAAGDLTDLVLDQVRKPRILRQNNYFDQVETLRRALPDSVMRRVRAAKPQGLWGAELCILASPQPTTILLLGGRPGELRHPHVQPPRLLLLREDAEQGEVIGDQAEAARYLVSAFRETKRRGLHHVAPQLDQDL